MRGTGTVKAHLVAAGKYHDIDFARLELLKLLAEHPEIRTSVSSDYANTARIEAADLLVTYTCDLVPTPDQTATIRAFLERGGRWLALHGPNSILRIADDAVVYTPAAAPASLELAGARFEIGRAHVCTAVTNAPTVCRR